MTRCSPDSELFTFGQPVENIAASEDNPTKRGFFVQYGPGRRMAEYASPRGVHTTPADNLRAAMPDEAATPSSELNQHIAWLKQYVEGMTAANWQDMRLRAERQLDQISKDLDARGVAQPVKQVREKAANAIRTFCQSLGAGTVTTSSDGVERIYYAGLSLDALSVAVALAISSTDRGGK